MKIDYKKVEVIEIDGIYHGDYPDYVDEVGIIADSTYHVIITDMEYLAHPNDGDDWYDIYLLDFQNQYGQLNYMFFPSHNSLNL